MIDLKMSQQVIENIRNLLSLELSRSGSGTMIYKQGHSLYLNGQCSLLSESEQHFRFLIDDKYGDFIVEVSLEKEPQLQCTCQSATLCRHQTAALLQLEELIRLKEDKIIHEGIKYTRKGMIQRVIEERKKKAEQARYSIEFSDNIFGEHVLTNERGVQYKLTFRDINRKHGYCNCPDYRINRLGTCKHLIYAFTQLQNDPDRIPQTPIPYPFIEVFLNPFRNNKISYFFPEKITGQIAELFYRYFGNRNFIEEDDIERFTGFLNNTHRFKKILVRPEVYEKVKKVTKQLAISRVKENKKLNLNLLKTNLLPFQVDGVEFATFNIGAMLADDIELGRITQAVATAIMKKDLFGFSRTLIICPANLRHHWKREIENLSNERLCIIERQPEDQAGIYQNAKDFFILINYDKINQYLEVIKESPPDLIILDEAQRIKNYESDISVSISSIPRKHTLLLSGNLYNYHLIELYALMMHVDQELLSPLWDFSYRYCIFDNHSSNRIIGFYNLDELDQRIEKIVLHRTKEQVIRHLPKVSYVDLPVPLHPVQIKIQLGLAKELLEILQKKIISQFELQQAVELIRKLRMVADSSFLVDDMTNLSPKTEELKSLLTERLNIRKKRKKVIIFTEWKRMAQVISRVLRLCKIKFVEITDETPEKQRTLSLKSFTTDPDCLVLVSSCATLDESEIKASDIVIHFDIPADRSLKSLRMGSISGIIQRDGNLTCFNLYSKNSIEERLNAGMEINLHEKGKKKETDIPTEIPKLIKSELIETLTDIINQGSEADESIQETLQRDESGQMVIDFASEEEISKVQKKSTSELSDFVFSDSLDLDEDKILQTLTNSTSLVAEMLKLATSDKADVQNYSPDFDPENGEILLRFKLLRKA